MAAPTTPIPLYIVELGTELLRYGLFVDPPINGSEGHTGALSSASVAKNDAATMDHSRISPFVEYSLSLAWTLLVINRIVMIKEQQRLFFIFPSIQSLLAW